MLHTHTQKRWCIVTRNQDRLSALKSLRLRWVFCCRFVFNIDLDRGERYTDTWCHTLGIAFQHLPPKEGCRKPVFGVWRDATPAQKRRCIVIRNQDGLNALRLRWVFILILKDERGGGTHATPYPDAQKRRCIVIRNQDGLCALRLRKVFILILREVESWGSRIA